jgi:hypothetical protein
MYGNKKDFLELFDVTSKLRKEQEEDSNLDKRLMRQHYDIEDLEERILIGRQRLIDAKRSLSENISAFDLLENQRNQRDIYNETYENLSKYELTDKRSKMRSLEEILIMPEMSFEEITKLKKDKLTLQNEIDKLETKIKNSANKSTELTIYKQNALQAASNKESALKILNKLEKEKGLLEHKYTELEKKFENAKGFKFVRKDDLLQQAENVKKKKELTTKYKKIIDSLKGDSLILDRTINQIKTKVNNPETIIKPIEDKYGAAINAQAKKELEELSRKKAEVDQSKAMTLEEYSKLIDKIRTKISETSNKHAPLVEQHTKIKKSYEELMLVHENKKKNYDLQTGDIVSQHNKTKEKYDKQENEFRDNQNKYHQLNIQLKINEEFLKRYEAEKVFLGKNDQKLNDNFKSYSEYYKDLLGNQEMFVKKLKEQQKEVKDSYDNNNRQVKYIFFNFNLFLKKFSMIFILI